MENKLPDLSELEKQLAGRPARTRFAPSPTGFLHFGHLANAIYVWGVARAIGGKVILRMEDHDRDRCRPDYEHAVLEVLEWLGLEPDEGAFGGPSDYRQSDCGKVYKAMLSRLRPHVYACDCSRKVILGRTGQEPGEEIRYDGYCRYRRLPSEDGNTLRLVMEPRAYRFTDLLAGPQEQMPAEQCGDMPLRDNKGNWTYQFAVVTDDIRHRITLVVRGTDILPSTGRQLQLMEMLGEDRPPVYIHHGLLTDDQGRKLSKRNFDEDLISLKHAGEDPAAVLGRAAMLAGLTGKADRLDARDLKWLFR